MSHACIPRTKGGGIDISLPSPKFAKTEGANYESPLGNVLVLFLPSPSPSPLMGVYFLKGRCFEFGPKLLFSFAALNNERGTVGRGGGQGERRGQSDFSLS